MAISTTPGLTARPKGPSALPLVPRWPGWRHLPRDARDTLFLIAVIGWTLLPHIGHLPWWCIGLSAVVLLWRTRLAIANAPLPGRWTLAAVLAVIAVLTLIDFRTLLGKEAGVSLLVALVALKTLELRARRDAFVVFFLGFFLVLTQFLYSQTIASALSMVVSTWGLLTALVLAHMPVGRPPFKRAAWLAARTALLGAPVMAVLFVLFPRVGPLWGVPQDGINRTGLSESMQLGSMAELALDDSIAMRLRFTGQEPAPQAMYFRGPVLSEFNGRDWTPAPESTRPSVPTQLRVTGFPFTYELTLEPQKIRVLPLLEVSPRAPDVAGVRVRLTDDLQWTTLRPLTERTRLTAQAYVDFRHGPTTPARGLRDFVQLPTGFNPRTLAWAAAFRNDARHRDASPRELADGLMRVISTEGYTYTLSPGEYGKDAIDEFWLDRKQGFCEHFAAAFVVIMRAMDVPARIVTGYQGAERNPVDGTYVVRQSSAHAWAEYWQEGVGWIRADPTAAVAPDRIVRGRNLLPAPGFVASALDGMSPELLTQLRNFWDAANNGWNQWVLNYSRSEQFGLLERLGFKSPDWEDLARLTAGVVVAVALAGIALAWLDKRKLDPWQRQMQRIHTALRALGIDASPHDTPRHLAARLRERFGPAADPLVALLESLERQRYSREALKTPARTLAWEFARQADQLQRSSA